MAASGDTVPKTPWVIRHAGRNLVIAVVAVGLCLCGISLVAYLNTSPEDRARWTAEAATQVAQRSLPATPRPAATAQPNTQIVAAPTSTESPIPTSTLPPKTATALARSSSGSATVAVKQTATAAWAGASQWLIYRDRQVGVTKSSWNSNLGFFRAETGKILISFYIVAKNIGDHILNFGPDDFGLVDGGGEISGRAIGPEKEPTFSHCDIKVGGTCEGWWTTQIWNRPAVTGQLVLQWNPGSILDSTQELTLTVKPPQ